VLDEIDSTHELALRLLEQLENEELGLGSTMFVALRQSRGTGRGNRCWESPPGGLYLSWIRSGLNSQTIARLPMVAAAGAILGVRRLGIDRVVIKWPNDLLVDRAKLAGVIVHARQGEPNWATVGLGVNLSSTPSVPDRSLHPPTSLSAHLKPTDWEGWVLTLASELVGLLSRTTNDPDEALTVWKKYLLHRPGDGLTVRLGAGDQVQGTFAGLTSEGYLRLQLDDGERVISSGEIVE